MVFFLILVSICAISQASATDDADFISDDESNIQCLDDSSINSDSEILADAHQIDSSNYEDDKIQNTIDSASDGDIIYLNGTFELNKAINVNKAISIVGVGDGAKIKSDSFSFVNNLFIISSSNVVLSNITFMGQTTGSNVLWQGDFGVIKNCKFNSNIASANAGAIFLSGNNCNITECSFTNNQARFGGAIYVEGNDNSISFSEFNDNQANAINSTAGGAIYSLGENLSINYCNFTANLATTAGGAIAFYSKKNTVFMCNFNGNYIRDSNKTGGGAIFSNDESLTVDTCTFINNYAPQSNGGAILGDFSVVRYSTFNENSAGKGKDIYTTSSSNLIKNYFYLHIDETVEDLVYGISSTLLNDSNNNFTIIKVDSKISFVSTGIIFDYGAVSDPIRITVNGGSVEKSNIVVLSKDKSKMVPSTISFSNGILRISNLPVGEYILRVTATPDKNHNPGYNELTITVKKASAVIKGQKITVAYKKGSMWTIKLVNSKTGKVINNMKLTLKVYTGKKYKSVTVTTNSKGEASYQTRKLSKGVHKVIVSAKDSRYNFNTLSSSIKVVKQKAIKFKVQRTTAKDGAQLLIQVMNKKTKKPINGVKVKLLIYSGKKYKTVTLKSKKYKKNNGICGYSTNKLTVGKHKVKILPNTILYSGSSTSSMKIAKNAKKSNPWETKISA